MFINLKYILIIGLTLRLLYTFVPQLDYWKDKRKIVFQASEQESDSKFYVLAADGLLKNGYPSLIEDNDKLIMIGGLIYPLLVALNLLISQNLIYLILFQVLLDVSIIYFIYIISFHLFNNTNISILTSLSYTIYYPNFFYPSRILTESVFTFLLILGVFFIVKFKDENGIKKYLLIGLLFSLAALTRAMMFYVFIFLLLFVFIYVLIKEKKVNYKLILCLLMFFIVQVPWFLMSYSQTGKLVFGSSSGSEIVLAGTYLPDEGNKDLLYNNQSPNHPINKLKEKAKQYSWNEMQMDSAARKMAIEQIKNNFISYPFESIKVMFYQFTRFWFNLPFSIPPSLGTYVILLINFIILVLSILGFIYNRKNKLILLLLLGVIIFVSLHLFTYNLIRYSAPLMPIILAFMSSGIYELLIKKFWKADQS